MSEQLLQDKIILVTGASDGIGKAAAMAYAKQGATVILLAKTVKKLEAVYDEIVANGDKEPVIVPMDLLGAGPKDYQHLFTAINDEFGQLDGILQNAGILGTITPIEHYDVETWYKVMQVNLNAPFILTKTLMPLLLKAKAASIIFISSGVAARPRAYWGPYAASKAAIDNFTKVLADELENTSVRANAVNPGAVRTNMRRLAFPAEDINTLRKPEEVMETFVHLMSDASKETNGEIIDISPKK